MAIKQISIFLENKQGKLSDTVRLIADAEINIRALSIADTQEFGILRLIVNKPNRAKALLSENTIVNMTDVIAVKMDDRQGALHTVLQILEDAGINVDYAYAFTANAELGAYVVFRVDDVAAAEALLTEKNVPLITDEDIEKL